MQILRRTLLLGCFALLCGCSPDSSVPALQYATLNGTVYDQATGQGVAGVVVTVNGVQPSAPTGSSGAYAIQNLPPGQVTVYVQVPQGYAGQGSANLTLVANQTSTYNIPLTHQ